MRQYKTFLSKYLRKYKMSLVLNFMLIILLTLLSGVAPYVMKIIVDNGIMQKDSSVIINFSIITIAVFGLYSLLNFVSTYKFTLISEFTVLNIKKDIFRKIMMYPMSFFSDKEKGYVLSRANEVNSLKILFSNTTFKLVLSIFEFIIASAFLLTINPILTVGVYLFLPIYYVFIKKMMKKSTSIISKTMEETAKANGKVQQLLNGIEEIKIFNKEKAEGNRINELNESITKLSIKQGIMINITTETIMLICNIISVLVLMLSGIYITKGTMSIGDYFAFSGYLPKLLAPVQYLSSSLISLQPAVNAFKRINEFFQKDIDEENKNKIKINDGVVEFKNIYFAYSGQTEQVLQNVNFKIDKGDKVLIYGKNGSGKTTILKLIMGLYDNYEGDIFIDDVNLKSINNASLRDEFGIVSQNIFLFSGTIKENILYSVEEYHDEDLIRALELSGLKECFQTSNLNIETNVGENGMLLSGGQKQMIAIARAIIKKPKIIIFDEATANLDSNRKQEIYKMIHNNFKYNTCLFVSHDLNIDIKFDKVIDLNKYN